MKRWLFIAAAALLTLGGLAWSAAPAMARDVHVRHAHVTVVRHGGTWRHDVRARHVAHVRVARHVRHRR